MTSLRAAALFVPVALVATACSVYREANPRLADTPADWRRVATDADRARLRKWHDAWDGALPRARAQDAAAVEAQGALFDPDRALGNALPPAGAYRCRSFKLGGAGTSVRDFSVGPWQRCRLDAAGAHLHFRQTDGAQRPDGLFFTETQARAIFLGALALGDERAALRYGQDATRDMAGYVEQVGAARWRLVLPQPRFESQLQVIELVPAG